MSNVLITGCSSGFGELAALLFADRGHRVFATMRTPGKSASLNARPAIEQLALDVCSTDSVNAAVADVIARCGQLHVLVNNAGVESFGAVHLFSDDEVVRQFDTNVTGVVRTVRAVVPHMLANREGAIVNVGSLAGRVGAPYGGMYARDEARGGGTDRGAALRVVACRHPRQRDRARAVRDSTRCQRLRGHRDGRGHRGVRGLAALSDRAAAARQR